MIVFILCIILAVIAVTVFGYLSKATINLGNFLFLSISAVGIVLILLFLLLGLSFIIGPIGDITVNEELSDTKELRALNDKVSVEGKLHGNIFVTNGHLNSIPIYAFYYTKNGVVRYDQVNASSTDIYIISENETPRLETYIVSTSASHLLCWPDTVVYHTEYLYKLYIPDNSIISDVQLDLK